MLAVVVASFATLWLPYRSYVVYNSFARRRYENRWFLLFCRLAVYANSAVNPILYNAMSAKFRGAFRAQLSCCCYCCCRRKFTRSSSSSRTARHHVPAFVHRHTFGISVRHCREHFIVHPSAWPLVAICLPHAPAVSLFLDLSSAIVYFHPFAIPPCLCTTTENISFPSGLRPALS